MLRKKPKFEQVYVWKNDGPKSSKSDSFMFRKISSVGIKKWGAQKKVGHSESTQIWVDTKCPISCKSDSFMFGKTSKL